MLTVHNLQPHRRRRFTPAGFHRFWSSLTFRQADALIVHGGSLRTGLLAQHPVQPNRVHVIAHGVWRPDAPDADAMADPVPPPPAPTDHGGAPVLLFYGTVRPNKGLHHLLDAFARAPAHWRLVVAGSPVGEEAYFNEQVLPRIERLRAAGRSVQAMFDYVPEGRVGALFERATLLLLPYTDFAAQSGVLFDAIAYRVPVVCTPAGALGDTVGGLGLGSVARSAEPDDLLAAIEAALARPRGQLLSALARAADENSWQRAGEQTLALYRQLLDHGQPSPGQSS
ncbi:MAG: glycosyltransferase [Burkholderiaceae bacterium]